MFMVQVQTVVEIENEECAKALIKELQKKYGNIVVGPYGLNI